MQTLEEYTIEKNDLEYEVKIVLDEYPDLSWLGEFTDKCPDKNYIDRKDGYFIGFDGVMYHTFKPEELPDGDDTPDDELIKLLEGIYPNHEIIEIYGSDNGFALGYDGIEIEFTAREILGIYGLDVPSWYERNSYRYWISGTGLSPSTDEETINKYGKDELLKYALQDYRRLYDYERGGWWMQGVIVSLNGVDASLWGVESDASKEYLQEVINDLIAEVNNQIPVEIASLREQADHLESILTNLS